MLEKALFDPGFAPCVYSFTDNMSAVNMVLHNIKTPAQRKFRFQMLKSQIITIIENNIAFYFGCLIWAKFLKETMPEKELANNPFLGVNLEEKNLTNEDLCQEINQIIEYLTQYTKDCKFYTGRDEKLPELWGNIAKIYKEFLLINKSFVNTKFCKDINLPENLNQINQNTNEQNKILIEKALQNKNLSILLS